MNLPKIVVGAGFSGRYVPDNLLARRHKVISLNDSARETTQGVELFLADVRDRMALIEFVAHNDAVIHLAAFLGTQESIGNTLPTAENHSLGGVNVLDGDRKHPLLLVGGGFGLALDLSLISSVMTVLLLLGKPHLQPTVISTMS